MTHPTKHPRGRQQSRSANPEAMPSKAAHAGNAQTNARRASAGKNLGRMKTDPPKETNRQCRPRADGATHSVETRPQKSLSKLPTSNAARETTRALRTACKGLSV